jgi:phage-related protein
MDENVVDTLKIEIVGDSGKAVDSIGKLISTLEKIKGATSGSNKGLNSIQKNLSKISEAVAKIDAGSASKLRDLADGLKGLNEVGNIRTGKTAERIVDLGAAVDLLKDVDFSKLTELADGLQALGAVGNVNVPRFDNSSAPTDNATPSAPAMDEQVFIPPSTVEETRSALNSLSADMSKNRSLWTDIANVAQGAFQKIDTALVPLKAKVAGVALAGVMQFNILKSKLSDVASAVSSKVGSAFEALKQKMQPVGNAARYVWNTITQPIQGVISTLGRVGSKFGEILSKAKAALTPIGTIAKSAFGKLGSLAGQGAKAVTKSFLKIAGAPLQKLKTSLSEATTKFRGLFTMFRKQAMYRAFSAIIHAIAAGFKEGMDNAYQYSKALGGSLASSLDSISTSFLYFKNSIGAAVAPLINMLAPAIEYIIDKCVVLINVLNQVFAKLSGASTWTKAVKYPTQYAEAANSATAANKELKKSILGIDEINALQDNSNSGSGGGSGASGQDYSQMFEEVQLGEVANPFADFFKPFADAWANEGQNTINAVKTAFGGIKDFCTAVGDSFREVWTNGTGQQTLEIILRIFQNILKCVGNLGSGLAKAWKANDNGTKILQNIWNIFNDLLSFVEGIYGATADWLATLDFTPLMTAFQGCTAALEPLVDLIGGTLLWLYQTVLLPMASWAIEEAAPASIDAITAALSVLQAFFEPFLAGVQELWTAVQPVVEWVESVVIVIINGVKSIFEKLAATFQEKGEKIQNIVSGIGDVISAVWVVVEPIFNLLKDLVGNVFSFIGDIISSVVGFVIDLFSGLIDFVAGVFTGDWERAWNGIKDIFVGIWDLIKGVALAIWEFLKGIWNSIKDNVESIWNGIKSFLSTIWNGIKNAAVSVWNGIKTGVMNVVNGIKNGITTAFNAVKTFLTNCMNTIKSVMTSVWNGIWGAIKGVINGILRGIESMVNGVIKGLNFMINALNKLSFDVPDWVPVIGGKKFGFNIRNISEVSLPRLENGGMVNAGTAFIAGEAGAEVVANIGNRTGVMNTDEMRESVAQGVVDANAEQNALLREEISILRRLLDKDTNVTAYVGTGSLISGLERKNRRDGRTIVPVGV